MKNSIDFQHLEKFLKEALEEDIGTGDITTNAVISDKEATTGKVIAKEVADTDDLILITGSFYTVGEALSAFSPTKH